MDHEQQHDWFLGEWLTELGINQAELARRAQWSKHKASDLYSGKQRYNRDILNETAKALDIEPWELLMHPDLAHDIRQIRGMINRASSSSKQFSILSSLTSHTDTPKAKKA